MNRAWHWLVEAFWTLFGRRQSSEELRREIEYRRGGWPGDA